MDGAGWGSRGAEGNGQDANDEVFKATVDFGRIDSNADGIADTLDVLFYTEYIKSMGIFQNQILLKKGDNTGNIFINNVDEIVDGQASAPVQSTSYDGYFYHVISNSKFDRYTQGCFSNGTEYIDTSVANCDGTANRFKFSMTLDQIRELRGGNNDLHLSEGHVHKITVTSGGAGYSVPPSVTISSATGDSGTGATAEAQISNGVVVSITINNGGSGYGADPTVQIVPATGDAGTGASADAEAALASMSDSEIQGMILGRIALYNQEGDTVRFEPGGKAIMLLGPPMKTATEGTSWLKPSLTAGVVDCNDDSADMGDGVGSICNASLHSLRGQNSQASLSNLIASVNFDKSSMTGDSIEQTTGYGEGPLRSEAMFAYQLVNASGNNAGPLVRSHTPEGRNYSYNGQVNNQNQDPPSPPSPPNNQQENQDPPQGGGLVRLVLLQWHQYLLPELIVGALVKTLIVYKVLANKTDPALTVTPILK